MSTLLHCLSIFSIMTQSSRTTGRIRKNQAHNMVILQASSFHKSRNAACFKLTTQRLYFKSTLLSIIADDNTPPRVSVITLAA